MATHKPIDFPIPEYCKRIQVNAEANGQWPGYLHDNDSSDNISIKNPNYCELTALYSMWKNCKANIQGLFHYRRYLSGQKLSGQFVSCWNQINAADPNDIVKLALKRSEIISALETYDIILATPVGYDNVMTIGEEFRAACYWKDTRELWRVIEEKYPDYLPSLEYAFSQNHYYGCNMFVARRDFVDNYCTWLFDILGEVEKRTSLEGYDTQHKRIYGYMAEHLLNVYVHRHNLKVKSFTRIYIISESRLATLLKKIPFLLKTVRALRKYLRRDTVSRTETEKFYVSVIHHNAYSVAEFTPKNPDNFIHDLEETMPEFELRAKSEEKIFAPRVILSSETPEDVRKSLFELGVRVIIR